MDDIFSYAVLRATPDALKGETVNVGLVVFHPDTVNVLLAPSLRKLIALDGSIDINEILELPETIKQWAARFDSVADKAEAIKYFGFVTLSELGRFHVTEAVNYESHVERLMEKLVLPRRRDGLSAAPLNRITTRLREMFDKRDVLGRGVDDIQRNLIVPNYPIAPKENLFSDFALRNGSMWFTETADFRGRTKGQLDNSRVAALAAIKVLKAREVFGKKAKTFVIYAADAESDVGSQVNLLRDYAGDLVNFNSRNQMAQYMQAIMNAAGHNKQLSN